MKSSFIATGREYLPYKEAIQVLKIQSSNYALLCAGGSCTVLGFMS